MRVVVQTFVQSRSERQRARRASCQRRTRSERTALARTAHRKPAKMTSRIATRVADIAQRCARCPRQAPLSPNSLLLDPFLGDRSSYGRKLTARTPAGSPSRLSSVSRSTAWSEWLSSTGRRCGRRTRHGRSIKQCVHSVRDFRRIPTDESTALQEEAAKQKLQDDPLLEGFVDPPPQRPS